MCALLNAIIFFAYPSVGFNHNVILFENLYSIATHALLLISSISMMSLELTDFSVNKNVYKEVLGLACMFIYAFLEIYWLKIEKDPMYFLPGNDVQAFLGVDHTAYLFIYVGFLAVYFSLKRKKPTDESPWVFVRDYVSNSTLFSIIMLFSIFLRQGPNLNASACATAPRVHAISREPDSAQGVP